MWLNRFIEGGGNADWAEDKSILFLLNARQLSNSREDFGIYPHPQFGS
jgi:hypothetical protein